MALLHATCVGMKGQGVLLTGASGSGKSDLALRLMGIGADLVADDQIILWQSGGRLFGRSPDAIAGLMESRGVGIRPMQYRRFVNIRLQVALVPLEDVPRLPEERYVVIEGVEIDLIELNAFDPSTPLKVAAALKK